MNLNPKTFLPINIPNFLSFFVADLFNFRFIDPSQDGIKDETKNPLNTNDRV